MEFSKKKNAEKWRNITPKTQVRLWSRATKKGFAHSKTEEHTKSIWEILLSKVIHNTNFPKT